VPLKQLRETYESKILTAISYYARKIIINYFTTKGSMNKVLANPSNQVLHFKDIISWIISSEYSKVPVSGVRKVYRGIHTDSTTNALEELVKRNLTKNDLAEVTRVCAKHLMVQESASDLLTQSNERLIEKELEATINSGNHDTIIHLFTWVQEQWDALSENIKKQKVDIDICKEYQRYAGISDASSATPEGQEVIECLDSSVLLPLHKMFSEEITSKLNAGMVITFDYHSMFLCTTATLKFYSDERGANLIAEINQVSNQGTQLKPLLFNHGKVWCMFDAGTSAILPKHMQSNVTGSLKCSVTLVPYEWTT